MMRVVMRVAAVYLKLTIESRNRSLFRCLLLIIINEFIIHWTTSSYRKNKPCGMSLDPSLPLYANHCQHQRFEEIRCPAAVPVG